jgi:hypothetical protein
LPIGGGAVGVEVQFQPPIGGIVDVVSFTIDATSIYWADDSTIWKMPK